MHHWNPDPDLDRHQHGNLVHDRHENDTYRSTTLLVPIPIPICAGGHTKPYATVSLRVLTPWLKDKALCYVIALALVVTQNLLALLSL